LADFGNTANAVLRVGAGLPVVDAGLFTLVARFVTGGFRAIVADYVAAVVCWIVLARDAICQAITDIVASLLTIAKLPVTAGFIFVLRHEITVERNRAEIPGAGISVIAVRRAVAAVPISRCTANSGELAAFSRGAVLVFRAHALAVGDVELADIAHTVIVTCAQGVVFDSRGAAVLLTVKARIAREAPAIIILSAALTGVAAGVARVVAVVGEAVRVFVTGRTAVR
jgi:hypothetical protein